VANGTLSFAVRFGVKLMKLPCSGFGEIIPNAMDDGGFFHAACRLAMGK